MEVSKGEGAESGGGGGGGAERERGWYLVVYRCQTVSDISTG